MAKNKKVVKEIKSVKKNLKKNASRSDNATQIAPAAKTLYSDIKDELRLAFGQESKAHSVPANAPTKVTSFDIMSEASLTFDSNGKCNVLVSPQTPKELIWLTPSAFSTSLCTVNAHSNDGDYMTTVRGDADSTVNASCLDASGNPTFSTTANRSYCTETIPARFTVGNLGMFQGEDQLPPPSFRKAGSVHGYYNIQYMPCQAGDNVTVYGECNNNLASDIKLFAHFLDANGVSTYVGPVSVTGQEFTGVLVAPANTVGVAQVDIIKNTAGSIRLSRVQFCVYPTAVPNYDFLLPRPAGSTIGDEVTHIYGAGSKLRVIMCEVHLLYLGNDLAQGTIIGALREGGSDIFSSPFSTDTLSSVSGYKRTKATKGMEIYFPWTQSSDFEFVDYTIGEGPTKFVQVALDIPDVSGQNVMLQVHTKWEVQSTNQSYPLYRVQCNTAKRDILMNVMAGMPFIYENDSHLNQIHHILNRLAEALAEVLESMGYVGAGLGIRAAQHLLKSF